jgi:hypothetical protein
MTVLALPLLERGRRTGGAYRLRPMHFQETAIADALLDAAVAPVSLSTAGVCRGNLHITFNSRCPARFPCQLLELVCAYDANSRCPAR